MRTATQNQAGAGANQNALTRGVSALQRAISRWNARGDDIQAADSLEEESRDETRSLRRTLSVESPEKFDVRMTA